MMEDGAKVRCRHCNTFIPIIYRVLSKVHLIEHNKENEQTIAQLLNSHRTLERNSGIIICPSCEKDSLFFVDTAMEVRYTPLGEFDRFKKKPKKKSKVLKDYQKTIDKLKKKVKPKKRKK